VPAIVGIDGRSSSGADGIAGGPAPGGEGIAGGPALTGKTAPAAVGIAGAALAAPGIAGGPALTGNTAPAAVGIAGAALAASGIAGGRLAGACDGICIVPRDAASPTLVVRVCWLSSESALPAVLSSATPGV
jgi:hypothetical protein